MPCRYNYDKKLSELSAADDDHPLKASNMSFANLSLNAEQANTQTLTEEISSVALDWKSMRNVTTCSCSTPFDQFSKKVSSIHCISKSSLNSRAFQSADTLLALRRDLL